MAIDYDKLSEQLWQAARHVHKEAPWPLAPEFANRVLADLPTWADNLTWVLAERLIVELKSHGQVPAPALDTALVTGLQLLLMRGSHRLSDELTRTLTSMVAAMQRTIDNSYASLNEDMEVVRSLITPAYDQIDQQTTAEQSFTLPLMGAINDTYNVIYRKLEYPDAVFASYASDTQQAARNLGNGLLWPNWWAIWLSTVGGRLRFHNPGDVVGAPAPAEATVDTSDPLIEALNRSGLWHGRAEGTTKGDQDHYGEAQDEPLPAHAGLYVTGNENYAKKMAKARANYYGTSPIVHRIYLTPEADIVLDEDMFGAMDTWEAYRENDPNWIDAIAFHPLIAQYMPVREEDLIAEVRGDDPDEEELFDLGYEDIPFAEWVERYTEPVLQEWLREGGLRSAPNLVIRNRGFRTDPPMPRLYDPRQRELFTNGSNEWVNGVSGTTFEIDGETLECDPEKKDQIPDLDFYCKTYEQFRRENADESWSAYMAGRWVQYYKKKAKAAGKVPYTGEKTKSGLTRWFGEEYEDEWRNLNHWLKTGEWQPCARVGSAKDYVDYLANYPKCLAADDAKQLAKDRLAVEYAVLNKQVAMLKARFKPGDDIVQAATRPPESWSRKRLEQEVSELRSERQQLIRELREEVEAGKHEDWRP